MFPSFSYPAAQSVSPAILSPHFLSLPSFPSHHSKLPQSQLQPKQPNKKMQRHTLRWWCGSCEVGGGYPDDGLGVKGKNGTVREQGSSKLEPAQYEALLKGLFKLEDMNVDDASEEVAVEIAAQGVLRKRVDEMEASFMMALDYMMQLADSDQDDSEILLLTYKTIVLVYTMETRPVVPDQKLLEYYGGWILDKRNDHGFNTLPESEVYKILVSACELLNQTGGLNLGKTVQAMIKNVMEGKNESADHSSSDDEDATQLRAAICMRRKPLPVRPGMFLETVSKKTLEVLREMAF
ncbi:hypothetical protein D8674_027181 [Pyrus ussuriensis x Pyrus communis]|uniref:Uncharacterized protein n=1 Tax=Pyrus ussuriensis x Pyrus communis TaxID=2448454 RepID=A0A5N5IBK5_9ROSA|nr:hypothetical protein D8674_027181 [Pyrus ussuriensis x Pyrus communis]